MSKSIGPQDAQAPTEITALQVVDDELLRQTRLELEETKQRLHFAMKWSRLGAWHLDRSGNAMHRTPEHARIFGYDSPLLEWSYDLFLEHVLPEDRAKVDRLFREAIAARSEWNFECRIRRTDGEVRWIWATGGWQENETEHSAQISGIVQDITERRHTEILLRESEEKFHAIFEGTLDGIVLIADTGIVVDCNSEFLRQTGMTIEQLRQIHIWDLRPPAKVESAKAKFSEILSSGASGEVDLKFKRADGNVIHVEFRSTVIIIGGKRYLQSISRDITERKQTDAQLHEYQQLLRELSAQGVASREAELKHIAREVHDELGQTLTALRMDISLLRIQFGERDPVLMDKIQDMLKLVDNGIRGVRDVTVNLRPPALDMGIVPAISWLCKEFPERSGTACTLQVIDQPDELSELQTTSLFRIVQESLTNVARHAAADKVAVIIRKCSENIVIEVRDDGRGFDSVSKTLHKSFGLLGMKERALALGGKVEITSRPAKGTVVFVRIPLIQTNPGRRSDDLPVDSRRSCDCARGLEEDIRPDT